MNLGTPLPVVLYVAPTNGDELRSVGYGAFPIHGSDELQVGRAEAVYRELRGGRGGRSGRSSRSGRGGLGGRGGRGGRFGRGRTSSRRSRNYSRSGRSNSRGGRSYPRSGRRYGRSGRTSSRDDYSFHHLRGQAIQYKDNSESRDHIVQEQIIEAYQVDMLQGGDNNLHMKADVEKEGKEKQEVSEVKEDN